MDGQVRGEEYGKCSLLKMRKGHVNATYVLKSYDKHFNWIFCVFLQVVLVTNRNSPSRRRAVSSQREGKQNSKHSQRPWEPLPHEGFSQPPPPSPRRPLGASRFFYTKVGNRRKKEGRRDKSNLRNCQPGGRGCVVLPMVAKPRG